VSCAKFECAGWDDVHGMLRCRCGLLWSQHSEAARCVEQPAPAVGDEQRAALFFCPQCGNGAKVDEDECCAECGATCCEGPMVRAQPAQEAALPHLERYSFVSHDFGGRIERDDHGIWARYAAANYWRTEALQQRERADGLEGERAELLKRVAERDGWVCELRERAEEAEAELRDDRKRSWQQARQAEIARHCNERVVESEWLTIKERNAWVDRARDAEAECLEQARLLGMGGEREAALLGKVERLERELAALKAEHAAALDRVRYSLRIFIHAHATGNSVPPHLVQQAGEALRDKEGA
jgi:hypothetical protein